MSKPKENAEPIIKAKLIEGNAISLSPKLDVNTDLDDIITECSKILNECGYQGHFLAIQDGREERTVYHYAGLAILHTEQAISKIEEKQNRYKWKKKILEIYNDSSKNNGCEFTLNFLDELEL